MHASNGILFNHESPIRGETFVTRKITRALSRIVLGMQDTVFLGNMSSKRDWGHAKDYVRAMYMILQQDKPDDYVIATGITTSIRDFVLMAGQEIGLEIDFSGKGVDEKGVIASVDEKIFNAKVGEERLESIKELIKNKKNIVEVDPAYFRPTDVDLLIGDPTKSRTILGWTPEYDLKGIIKDMMQYDIRLMKKDAFLKDGGYKTFNYFE